MIVRIGVYRYKGCGGVGGCFGFGLFTNLDERLRKKQTKKQTIAEKRNKQTNICQKNWLPTI